MPKEMKISNLFKDLEYTVFGTEAHQFIITRAPLGEEKMSLELGCGCGKFSINFAMLGTETILVDIDPEVITYARRIRGAVNALLGYPLPIQIKLGNLFNLRVTRESFDLVFNEGVPQHWTDEQKRQGCINIMANLSKDMVMVIGNNGLREEEQRVDESFDFSYKGMPLRRKCFTPDELEMRLKKAGLKRVQVEGVTPGRIEDSYLIGGYGYKKT